MSAKGFERSHLLQKVEDAKSGRRLDGCSFAMIWDDELIFINTGIKVSKQLINKQDVVTITWVPPWRGTCLEHVWNMRLWRWACFQVSAVPRKCWMRNMLDAMSLQQTTWSLFLEMSSNHELNNAFWVIILKDSEQWYSPCVSGISLISFRMCCFWMHWYCHPSPCQPSQLALAS